MPRATASTAETPRPAARAWTCLAAGSLLLAGIFAIALVLGRLPFLAPAFPNPGIFRRFLVVHVDLSLVVWFSAFLAGFGALAARGAGARWSERGAWIAAAGVALLATCAALPSAEPVLSNYVPAIDSPAFTASLAVIGLGLLVACAAPLVAWRGASPEVVPPGASPLARGAMLVAVVAVITFAASFATTPVDLAPQPRWELRAWGGGHVLQIANVAAMLAVWVTLTARASGRSPLGARAASCLAALLAAPVLAAPAVALAGTTTPLYRTAFTQLMRWGTWPVTLVVLVACGRELARARRDGDLRRPWRDARVLAVAASAAMCLTGFVLGALIRGSSTLVPGHYHASIGAVTCAFMAVALHLAPELGLEPIERPRLTAIQPPLFAAGQLLFAIGFSIAGAAGMGRKVYGAEQAVTSATQHAGLALMGLGGLVAVAGGVLFLGLVLPAMRRRGARAAAAPLLLAAVGGDR